MNGMSGFDGMQGLQGIQGFDGIQGMQGVQGSFGKSTYDIYKELYPSATIEQFIAALQGVQGPRGYEGGSGSGGGGCGCGCGCDKCKISDTLNQFIPLNTQFTIDFEDLLYEVWNDNIIIYVDENIPSEITISGHILELQQAAYNRHLSVHYDFFDATMGNYILITAKLYVPSDAIN